MGKLSKILRILEMKVSLLRFIAYTYRILGPGYLPGVAKLDDTGENKDAHRRLLRKHSPGSGRERKLSKTGRRGGRVGSVVLSGSGMEFCKPHFFGV